MEKLDAVNRVLTGIGEPPVDALETGATSDAGEAEMFVDRADEAIQEQGWHFNTTSDYRITVPSVTISYIPILGEFVTLEQVTQAGSGAVGVVGFMAVGLLYVAPTSGTFDDVGVLTGSKSGATGTATGKAAVASSQVGLEVDWILTRRAFREAVPQGDYDFEQRGRAFRNLDDTSDVFEAGKTLAVHVIAQVEFRMLADVFARLIVALAALEFQRYRKGGSFDDSVLRETLRLANEDCRRHNNRARSVDFTKTFSVQRITGRRLWG